jgi:hypothetical protein
MKPFPLWRGMPLVLALAGTSSLEAKDKATTRDLNPMAVVQAVTCKSVTRAADRIEPVEPTDQFWTSDRQVVSVVSFEHVLKSHTVRWRWYDPQERLYVESADLAVTPTGKYHRTFVGTHRILVAGERAMLHPGIWKVVVYLNGGIAATSEFALAAPRSGP